MMIMKKAGSQMRNPPFFFACVNRNILDKFLFTRLPQKEEPIHEQPETFSGSVRGRIMTPLQITNDLGGVWHRDYGRAQCPACGAGRRNHALSVKEGPAGRLLIYCHAGCSHEAILDALNKRGLQLGSISAPTQAEQDQFKADKIKTHRKASAQAMRCWDEAKPIAGTVGEGYLRNRGITMPLPGVLRFHPDCWHPTAKRFPAMVAMIEGGSFRAVHRTYLMQDGSGKADVEPAKAMKGPAGGGAVRLVQGPGPLVIGEGIETCLSVAQLLESRRPSVWAALSTGGMKGLILPKRPSELVIAADGDQPGREAADVLARRASKGGWSVCVLQAPAGQDFNDVLRNHPQRGGAECPTIKA